MKQQLLSTIESHIDKIPAGLLTEGAIDKLASILGYDAQIYNEEGKLVDNPETKLDRIVRYLINDVPLDLYKKQLAKESRIAQEVEIQSLISG